MNNDYQATINSFLDTLLFKLIKTQQIDKSELKMLLLICYHQLISDNPDKLTNSFLITVLKQFIDIEDYNNIILPAIEIRWNEENGDQYLHALLHPRVMEMVNNKENS